MEAPVPHNDGKDNDAILDPIMVAEAQATLKDKFQRIVGFFLEDSETYVRQISEGWQKNSVESIIPPAHTLKSSARQMGACWLSNAAKIIEALAKEMVKNQGDIAALKGPVESLPEILKATVAAFK